MATTMLYAGLLGLWFLVLSVRVIQGRMSKGSPSLGDGGNESLLRRIRGHANFAEYVPLTLLLIAFLEYSGLVQWLVHALGASLLVGRLLHGYAFAFTANYPFGRSGGVVLTLATLFTASALCIWQALSVW